MLRLSFCLMLAGLLSCGGGSTTPATVEGTWLFFLTDDGVDDDPRHLTIRQDGAILTADFTCDGSRGEGTGLMAGDVLSLSFGLSSGETLAFTGALGAGPGGASIEGEYTRGQAEGTWRMETTEVELDCVALCDPVEPEVFVASDVTDLSMIKEVSLLRSSLDRSVPSACESCRNMRHHYRPREEFIDNRVVPIFSPVDGEVVAVRGEAFGESEGLTNKQVRIRSTEHPEYTFILGHIDLAAPGVQPGDLVTAGEMLGHARFFFPDLLLFTIDFDVTVRFNSLGGDRFVSIFELMTEQLFEDYTDRGIPTRAAFSISRGLRDAAPLECEGSTFISEDALPVWVLLAD